MHKSRVLITTGCCLIFAATIAFAQEKNPVATGGSSPLVNASLSGNIEVVRDLIAKGADVNGRDDQGNFPLYAAVAGDHADIVELLVSAGVDINTFANLNEENAKRIKDMLDNPQTSKFLKPETVASLQAKLGEIGVTPLTVASRFGYANIATILLDRGADPNLQKPGSNTALIEAAIAGKQDIVELLISRKADLNRVREIAPRIDMGLGGTALALALLNEQYESAKILLTAGADFQFNDSNNDQWRKHFSWGAYQFLVAEKLKAEGKGAEAKEKLTDALVSLTAARDELKNEADNANKSADEADQHADEWNKRADQNVKLAKSAGRWAKVSSVLSFVPPPLSTDPQSIHDDAKSLRSYSTLDRERAASNRKLAGSFRESAASDRSSAQDLLRKAAACDSLIQSIHKLLKDESGTEKAP
jgi:ankyrin repeat protein